MFHMDLGLGRIQAALEALGLAHPPYRSVQVVGTNGKGSTSTFLAEILSSSGLRTGLYTSPHFVTPRERVLVDGKQLPDASWLEAAEAVLRVSQDISPAHRLTYFELITVMAAWMFRQAGCAAAVFEAGLGGAHDATSAIMHDLTVITPIGMDHAKILGPTLMDIARDKALAMREGVPAVSAAQVPEVLEVVSAVAAEKGAPLSVAEDVAATHGASWPDATGMPGPHQLDNLRLALAAHHLLATAYGLPVDAEALARAARDAFIPGRLQVIPPSTGWPAFVLDGAHNVPGLECLGAALGELGIRPDALIFACLGDKDVEAMLPLARGLTEGPIYVPGLDAPGRALEPHELAARLGDRATPVRDMAEAFRKVKGTAGTVLVCGSLYLLAEVYKLRPLWLRRGGNDRGRHGSKRHENPAPLGDSLP
nr:Mur ligase family protein [Fundidesulfovibrio terrae]